MLECECSLDGDSEGAFVTCQSSVREYRTCSECGATIWPWEQHRTAYWWDCDRCDRYDDCDDPGGEECCLDLPEDSVDHICQTCDNACKSLLCGQWWVGMVWELIAERNEMTRAECLGRTNKEQKP